MGALMFEDTPKGRVFLDIVSRVANEYYSDEVSDELAYILNRLECPPVSAQEMSANEEVFPQQLFVALVRTIHHASNHWGIELSKIDYSNKKVLRR